MRRRYRADGYSVEQAHELASKDAEQKYRGIDENLFQKIIRTVLITQWTIS